MAYPRGVGQRCFACVPSQAYRNLYRGGGDGGGGWGSGIGVCQFTSELRPTGRNEIKELKGVIRILLSRYVLL